MNTSSGAYIRLGGEDFSLEHWEGYAPLADDEPPVARYERYLHDWQAGWITLGVMEREQRRYNATLTDGPDSPLGYDGSMDDSTTFGGWERV